MRWVAEYDDKLVVVRGYQAGDRLRHDGMKPLWSGRRRGWMLDRHLLGDVEVYCQRAGIWLRVVDVSEAA